MFDGVGKHGFSRSWACVKKRGILCAFGFSDAVRRAGSVLALGAVLLRLQFWNAFGHARARFYSVTATRKAHPEWYRTDLEAFFDLLLKGRDQPTQLRANRARRCRRSAPTSRSGHLDGKIVICP